MRKQKNNNKFGIIPQSLILIILSIFVIVAVVIFKMLACRREKTKQ